MTDTLDTILSGREPASEQATTVETVTQPEGESRTEQLIEAKAGVEGEQQGQKMVPHEALHAEKQKVKRYTDEVADFRKSNEALQRQVSELLQRVPVPKQEQPAPPDFFENPAGATRHEVQSLVTPQFEQLSQTVMANAQLVASIKYGDDKVTEAEQAFMTAVQSRKVDPADYHKVVGSPNRYAAAVQWHQRQLAQAEIGDDPAAFRAKVEAEILAKHGLTPETNGGQKPAATAATVMPSNLANARNVGARSGPAWSGPTPIGDILAQPSIFAKR